MKARDSLPLVRDEVPVVCRFLRTKAAYGSNISDESAWQRGETSTAPYWCLATMEAFGPDDGLVDAHSCRSGRGCFEDAQETGAGD